MRVVYGYHAVSPFLGRRPLIIGCGARDEGGGAVSGRADSLCPARIRLLYGMSLQQTEQDDLNHQNKGDTDGELRFPRLM
ncbi:MAG TPA: hypothetical protein DEP67_00875, partial [Lachnospiraceae bacterium]|nr:hypothetical protein [Lachnospiraceae bacterium]